MTPIYVINIPTSIIRRENIIRQFKEMNIDFDFFTAINGKNETNHLLFNRYNEEYTKKHLGRVLTKGQLGCFASHFLLWEICINLNKNIIILEDDALINNDLFHEFYINSMNLDPKFECVRLFKNKKIKYKSKKIASYKKYNLSLFDKGHRSTTGYLLSPSGAKKLINNCTRWSVPVDIYMDQFWVNDIKCYGVEPECLTHNPQLDSDIGYQKEKKSFPTKIKREAFNFSELIRRTIYNIRHK